MKKLTAGIFATILGVTAMGAADAAVTSKGYVDAAVDTVAQSVTDLGTTVASTYATKQALAGEVTARTNADTTLQGNIDELAGTVGTLPEGITATTVVGYVDEKTTGIATSGDITLLQTRVKTIEDDYITTQELTDSQDVQNLTITAAYQAADATTLQVAKDYADTKVYNDTQVKADILANTQAIDAIEADYLKNADLATYATQEYADNAATTAANGKDAAIADAKKAGTDAAQAAATAQAAAEAADGKAVAAQGTADDAAAAAATNAADIVNLKAADAKFELKANVSGAAETTTGKYVLTKIDDGQGNVSFGWELIDRDYVSTDVTPDGQ